MSSNNRNPAATSSGNMYSYERTWEEIESMLAMAEERSDKWIEFYESSRSQQDTESMKDAARNKKALEGVIKTLRWVLGEEGIDHPLH